MSLSKVELVIDGKIVTSQTIELSLDGVDRILATNLLETAIHLSLGFAKNGHALELAEIFTTIAMGKMIEVSEDETCPLSGAPCDSLKASCKELTHCYLKDGEEENHE